MRGILAEDRVTLTVGNRVLSALLAAGLSRAGRNAFIAPRARLTSGCMSRFRNDSRAAVRAGEPIDALDDLPPENFGPDEGAPDEREELLGADLDLNDESAAPAAIRAGVAAIRQVWRTLPLGPGVYRMLAADGEVLYVGKARSLKRRVASYTRAAGHNGRIARVIAATAAMAFVSTRTETEALLLEANYIKQMRPRFNVLLRDDKSFPYILVTGDHEAPQILKHRGARNRKGDYFGPFAGVWAVNRTLNALQRAFLLRTCSDSYYSNRTRPCLLYQIKRCSGPCTGEVSAADYAELVRETRAFLSGRSRAVRERLAADMAQAAEALEFERAARLRDRIAALSAIQGTQGINPKSVEEADVFAVCEQAGQFCVEVFFFRSCQNWGNRTYFPRADRSLSEAEVLDAFLAQFYADRPAPRLILLSHAVESAPVLAQALAEVTKHKVEVAVPRRGERRDLVQHAAQNGREALSRRLAETATQEKLLAALAAAFAPGKAIRRVEVYDNSHIMGTNPVGAMIVAGPAGFMRTHYRTFNIKGEELTPGDDFGMMREVLRRRFSRLLKEAPGRNSSLTLGLREKGSLGTSDDGPAGLEKEPPGSGSAVDDDGAAPPPGKSGASSPLPPDAQTGKDDPDAFPAWPDLILVDGGKGQLEAARATLDLLGVTGVAIVGIAKGPDRNAGRETFFVPGREAFKLSPRDPALYFVQRLRDEAHRFAIGTHRARRKKELTRSPLDEIGGIGPARKRALLSAFGTAKAIARAALPDLERVPGINAATAKLVYDYFHERVG